VKGLILPYIQTHK